MPTGPKGQKRPADVIGNAVRIAQIATGEIEDDVPNDGKDPAAKALGAKGGRKPAENMTPERRKEIAQKRWSEYFSSILSWSGTTRHLQKEALKRAKAAPFGPPSYPVCSRFTESEVIKSAAHERQLGYRG